MVFIIKVQKHQVFRRVWSMFSSASVFLQHSSVDGKKLFLNPRLRGIQGSQKYRTEVKDKKETVKTF